MFCRPKKRCRLTFLKENHSMLKSLVDVKCGILYSTLSTIIENEDFIEKNFENNIKTMKKDCACFFTMYTNV